MQFDSCFTPKYCLVPFFNRARLTRAERIRKSSALQPGHSRRKKIENPGVSRLGKVFKILRPLRPLAASRTVQ